jgi:metal-sulfur cluster biosynthetic enzyme
VPSARQLTARLVVTILLVAIGILIILLPYILRRQKIPTPSLTAAATFTDCAVVPAGTPPPDSTAVMAAMNRVVDPEVGIGIADLGLVNALGVDSAGNVSATVILTVPECPYAGQLGAQAVKEVLKVPGVRRARVRLDPTLPWDPTRLTPKASELYRKRFGYLPRQNDEARNSNPESSSNAGK